MRSYWNGKQISSNVSSAKSHFTTKCQLPYFFPAYISLWAQRNTEKWVHLEVCWYCRSPNVNGNKPYKRNKILCDITLCIPGRFITFIRSFKYIVKLSSEWYTMGDTCTQFLTKRYYKFLHSDTKLRLRIPYRQVNQVNK